MRDDVDDLTHYMQATSRQRDRADAAERECDHLRARQETAVQFADQYLAERDQLRALLRRIHAVTAHAGLPLGQRIHALIDESGLLDDERPVAVSGRPDGDINSNEGDGQ